MDFVQSLPFLLAGSLSAVTLAIHVWIGGPEVAAPILRARELTDGERYTAYYCWHLVTIMLAAMAAGFLIPALSTGAAASAAIWTLIAAAAAFWSIGLSVRRRLGPLVLPQWALFGPIAMLGVWGLV